MKAKLRRHLAADARKRSHGPFRLPTVACYPPSRRTVQPALDPDSIQTQDLWCAVSRVAYKWAAHFGKSPIKELSDYRMLR